MSGKSSSRNHLPELVCLNLIGLLGPILFDRLIDRFGSAGRILSASLADLMSVDRVGPKLANEIVKANLADAEKEMKLAAASGVGILTRDEFPPGLQMMDDRPIVLYVKGSIEDMDAVAVAVVGSRRCTIYGSNQAEKLGYFLSNRGVTVVSGMARGIDSAAHRGALKAEGRTIAVLGNGLSTVYPAENSRLFNKICGSGAVISEFSMRTPPAPGNFPRRNRLISGLSLGVVVVEAARASGSLITARYAIEQGKEVFAVPGKAGSPTSKGTHSLIKDGAKLVESVDDVLEELGELGDVLAGENEARVGDNVEGDEKQILELLSVDEPLDIEDVIQESGLNPSKVSSVLMRLELKGLVKALPGKRFVRKQSL